MTESNRQTIVPCIATCFLLRPPAPSTTSWSPSLPEGGNQAIGAGVYPFAKDLLQCVERITKSVGHNQFAGRGGACSSRISGQMKTLR